MWPDRRLLELFDIEHPIIQAPMASATNAELVAAVSEAGGLGSFGAAATPPDRLRATVQAIRQRTNHSFNINLFSRRAEQFDRSARPGNRLAEKLKAYHAELGLGPVPEPGPMFGPAGAQLDVLIEEQVPVISFHFGIDAADVARAHEAGARVICSATTAAESRALEDLGVDAVIAQGAEAGGHRGTFSVDSHRALIGTLALVPQVVDAVSVPVIAAGGIMDARGIVACLALGAAGVQMGTAFLGCPEAPIADAWRKALRASAAEATHVTEAMSGGAARAIRNRYIDEVEALGEPLLPYPAQYSVSRALRAAAAERGDPEFMAMWAGQGVGLIRNRPAAELVNDLVTESRQLLDRLGRR
ncbi:MAG TPA: nitronate monooxygenase [Gammaproteobacteria bacterium]|nr:nitronate monooxygenase [Gammaproteobacteria bacterium]